MQPTRVILDPNVWISALISPSGTPARLVEAIIADRLVTVVTQQLLDELAAVLLRPKLRRWVSIADAIAFVDTLAGHAEVHPDPGAATQQVRDPNDEYLVALAEATGAVLVTGDADLLDAKLDPPAITPRALLDLLAERDE